MRMNRQTPNGPLLPGTPVVFWIYSLLHSGSFLNSGPTKRVKMVYALVIHKDTRKRDPFYHPWRARSSAGLVSGGQARESQWAQVLKPKGSMVAIWYILELYSSCYVLTFWAYVCTLYIYIYICTLCLGRWTLRASGQQWALRPKQYGDVQYRSTGSSL